MPEENEYTIADRRYESLITRSCEVKLKYILYKKLILDNNPDDDLKEYIDCKIPKFIIYIYANDYKNMSKVRERNRVFRKWISDNYKEVAEFKESYREYFNKRILGRNDFANFYHKNGEKEK